MRELEFGAPKEDFHAALLDWFESEKRDFPWRRTRDPFKILIAERLLQQTRATPAVVSAYKRLVRRYPTPARLATAQLSDLEHIIQPLGLLFRAKQLRRMANELVDRHSGGVPCSYGELMELTGVGEYCASAVLSFAFGEDAAVVDTNVGRFLYRLFDISQPFPANPSRTKWLHKAATALLPPGRSRAFNLAVLDLCAKVCAPSHPTCGVCPVHGFCRHAPPQSPAASSRDDQ